MFATAIPVNSSVVIKTNSDTIKNANGHYEFPHAMEKNPENENLSIIFCENKSLKNPDPSLIKIKINSENKTISLYDNSYKTKLWYFNEIEKILKIKLLTRLLRFMDTLYPL